MGKLVLVGLVLGLAAAAYWYLTRADHGHVEEYVDTLRDRVEDAAGAARRTAGSLTNQACDAGDSAGATGRRAFDAATD
jgi:hypothetical protein